MHRRRQTSLGIARSGSELFCSVSSTPRSPSPSSKQDLNELLQQRHRMHSFTRRLKNYMSEKDSSPEVEIPSYMRQTCSSLIKRSNSRTRSKNVSTSAEERGSWDDDGNMFSGRRFKSVRKALTVGGGGSSSFALTLDGHPQSTVSKLDSLATLSTDFAYTSSNFDELDSKLRNEHTILETDTTDEALFMTPAVQELFDDQVPKKGTRTRDSSVLLSDGILCSVNAEFGTSSNSIRFHEARGSFEDVFLTNSHVEELDFQSNDRTISHSVKSLNHQQPSLHSPVREDMHTEVLLSSGPDEQDFLCGNRGQELQEITRPDYNTSSLKSTSSSLHRHNMFCNTDESHEPFLRRSFSHDFQLSNSMLQLSTNDLQLTALNQFYDDRSESGLSLDSFTREGSSRRQSLSDRSSQEQDLEAMDEPEAALSHPSNVCGPDPNREDTKPAEDGCLGYYNSLTEGNSDFYVTSGQMLDSISSLGSSSEYPAPNEQFISEVMESEELRSEQQKTEDSLSPKASLSSLQNQSSCCPSIVQEPQIKGLEDPGKMETADEERARLSLLGPIKTQVVQNNTFKNSSIVYHKKRGGIASLSGSEDEISETESFFLVQCTKPRSLSELCGMQQRPPSADDIALFAKSPRSEVQFRDDHSSTLLNSFPADLHLGQELSIVLDPVLDQSSPRFSEVKEGSEQEEEQDMLFVVPRDQLKNLAKFEKRSQNANNSANCSGSARELRDQSANQQSIGKTDSAEHCCDSEIGSAKAAGDDQTIEQNAEYFGRSSHSFGRLQVRSSVPVRPEKGLKKRLQKLVHTVKETYQERKIQQETKKRFPHCFQFSMKSCFGCSKAAPVLYEVESMGQKRDLKRGARKNHSTLFN